MSGGLKMHPRVMVVQQAEVELNTAWLEIRKKLDLTEGELISVLTDFASKNLGSLAKYMIRMERHGTPDKPGGLE